MEQDNSTSRKADEKKQTVIIVVAATVLSLAGIYYGYQWITRNDCNNIFEQTTDRLQGSFTVIENKGEIALGREKVQELAEGAQKVALHLKTCCMTLQNKLIDAQQFQSCMAGANDYENRLNTVASMIREANTAQIQGNSQLAEQKVEQAREAANLVLNTEKMLDRFVSPFTQTRQTQAAQIPSVPNDGEHARNLLLPEYVELITAPRQEWEKIFTEKDDFRLYTAESEKTVFGFKNGKEAIITGIRICIPENATDNIKSLELLISTNSPNGQYESAGIIETQNIRMMKTDGWQEFALPQVRGKYFKCIIKAYDYDQFKIYSLNETKDKSIQIIGTLIP